MWSARLIVVAAGVAATCCSAATRPVGRIEGSIDDARMAAAVRTAIVNDPELGLREIVIEARRGAVTLTGQVGSDEEAQRARALAEKIAGVREVKSGLRVGPDSGGYR